MEATAIIAGDSKIYSIAAASIVAKVTRDRIMRELHEKFPAYGFDQHKGYPSPAHRATLAQLGPCEEHRMSYRPVREAAERRGNEKMLARWARVRDTKTKNAPAAGGSPKKSKNKGKSDPPLTPIKSMQRAAGKHQMSRRLEL